VLKIPATLIQDAEEQYLAWLLSAMVPYRDAPQPTALPGKKLPLPVATGIAREGFKATNRVCDVITASVRNHQEITTAVRRLSEKSRFPNRQYEGEDPLARDVLGMAIRRWGSTWRSQATFALLVNIADEPDAAKGEFCE
jgi:tRNA nucleotidyltransferase (CCA-adding enzyme)